MTARSRTLRSDRTSIADCGACACCCCAGRGLDGHCRAAATTVAGTAACVIPSQRKYCRGCCRRHCRRRRAAPPPSPPLRLRAPPRRCALAVRRSCGHSAAATVLRPRRKQPGGRGPGTRSACRVVPRAGPYDIASRLVRCAVRVRAHAPARRCSSLYFVTRIQLWGPNGSLSVSRCL